MKRQWENYVVIERHNYWEIDTHILLTRYIYIGIYFFEDHFKMKTDNSSGISGWVGLFPETKGKRGKRTR